MTRSRFGRKPDGRSVCCFFERTRRGVALSPKGLACLEAIAVAHGGKRIDGPTTFENETAVEYFFATSSAASAFVVEADVRNAIVTPQEAA